mmetsp:Transcript_115909/g.322740  ORF Transcript_115909/g.322740 Transcript_115909/m.322740 type:complete len:422 (-) Transcript_115909:303-1568(-)
MLANHTDRLLQATARSESSNHDTPELQLVVSNASPASATECSDASPASTTECSDLSCFSDFDVEEAERTALDERWECSSCGRESWECPMRRRLELGCCSQSVCCDCAKRSVRDFGGTCPAALRGSRVPHEMEDLDIFAACEADGNALARYDQLKEWKKGGRVGIMCGEAGCRGVVHPPPGGFSQHPGPIGCRVESCQAQYCQRCRGPWTGVQHECEDLRAAREQREQERGRRDQRRDGVMFCPRCNVAVQRTQGCNAMRGCPCGAEWCWECGNLRSAHGCGHYRCRCPINDRRAPALPRAAAEEEPLRAPLRPRAQVEILEIPQGGEEGRPPAAPPAGAVPRGRLLAWLGCLCGASRASGAEAPSPGEGGGSRTAAGQPVASSTTPAASQRCRLRVRQPPAGAGMCVQGSHVGRSQRLRSL